MNIQNFRLSPDVQSEILCGGEVGVWERQRLGWNDRGPFEDQDEISIFKRKIDISNQDTNTSSSFNCQDIIAIVEIKTNKNTISNTLSPCRQRSRGDTSLPTMWSSGGYWARLPPDH